MLSMHDDFIRSTQHFIQPGKFPNIIKLEDDVCRDDDSLDIAVLTTPSFNALTVDVSILKLGDPLLGRTATSHRFRVIHKESKIYC